MDMGILSMNLQSLQQTVSMAVLDRAMNVETATASAMIADFTSANPAAIAVDGVGANINVLA